MYLTSKPTVSHGSSDGIGRTGFYRAFVFLLPSNARFSTARAATIQAARDLYGVGSPAARAVTEAWSPVGVF
jgi:Zn-dependent metalloprotease